MNFKDSTSNIVNIDSIEFKQEKKVSSTSQCQTSSISYEEVGVQAFKKKSIGIQTEGLGKMVVRKEDEEGLKLFLRRVEEMVIFNLNKNYQSKAFNGYTPLFMELSKVISRHASIITSRSGDEEKFPVTSLCWNCTGTILVAGHGKTDHEDCCTHHTCISLSYTDKHIDNNNNYHNNNTKNIDDTKNNNTNTNNNNNNNNDKESDAVIEMEGCVSCMQTHPRLSYVLAVGTCNGNIRIFDISKKFNDKNSAIDGADDDDCVIAQTDSKDDHHLDLISSINWVTSSNSPTSSAELLTSSLDGSIFSWSFELHAKKITPLQGYVILTENLPRPIRAKVGSRGVVSITCLAVSGHDRNIFLAGSDVGAIFKCSLHLKGSTITIERKASLTLMTPHVTSFSAHKGSIHSICIHPLHPNLFLTASSDGIFSLYSMHKESPLLQTHPSLGSLLSCLWSPFKSTCVALVSIKGDVAVYEIQDTATCGKVASFNVASAGYSAAFNAKRPSLLATGDAAGVVTLWEVGGALQNTTPSDLKLMNLIAGEIS